MSNIDLADYQFVKIFGDLKDKPYEDSVELTEEFELFKRKNINKCYQPRYHGRNFLQSEQRVSNSLYVMSIIARKVEENPEHLIVGINNYRSFAFKPNGFLVKRDLKQDSDDILEDDDSGGWRIMLEQEDPMNNSSVFGINYGPVLMWGSENGLKHNYQMLLTLRILPLYIKDVENHPDKEYFEYAPEPFRLPPFIRIGSYTGEIYPF